MLALPEVIFLPEASAAATEAQMAAWSDGPAFPPNRWTDAWLAALAFTTRSRLVSFDSDFHAVPGLRFFRLVAP